MLRNVHVNIQLSKLSLNSYLKTEYNDLTQ